MSNQFLLIISTLWLGFVLAISFMESWLKFRADGVTQKIGLGIGKLVFTALNRMELLFAALILILLISHKDYSNYLMHFPFYLLFAILLIQSFYYLPKLHKRVRSIINDETVDKSSSHTIYIILEIIKVTLLVLYISFLV